MGLSVSEQFLDELCSQNSTFYSADTDLRYALDLQKKRLADENLRVVRTMKPAGHSPEGRSIAMLKDEHFTSTVHYHSMQYNQQYYDLTTNKMIKQFNEKTVFYTVVTDTKDYHSVSGQTYVCPGCGAISTVEQLSVGGCPYCNSKFKISELYPKLSNYYAVEDFGGTEKEIKSEIIRYILPCVFIFLIINTIAQIRNTFSVWTIISVLFMSVLGGMIIGYLLWCFRKIGHLFIKAFEALPILFSTMGSRKKFVELMQKYSESYSFDFFCSKVMSLIRMVIYSRHDDLLPVYTGENTVKYDHVIETSYFGGLSIKSFKVKNGICTVKADAYVTNYYHKNNRIFKKNEKLKLQLQRNLNFKEDYGFSIQKISCKHCGGSYSLLKHKKCPYCGNEAQLNEYDWIITELK